MMLSPMFVHLLRQVNRAATIAAHTQQFKNTTTTFLSTSATTQGISSRMTIEPTWWRRFLKMDVLGRRRYINKEFAYRLYLCCSDGVDHKKFFSYFKMDDTFNSLFLITELHVWMMSARVMQEHKIGRQFRYDIVEAMWKDIDKKSKVLGLNNRGIIPSASPSVPSSRKEELDNLCEQMQASFYAYDEGLLSNDTVLASALWRRFSNQRMENVYHLETLVNYVRRSMHHLDAVEQDDLLSKGLMEWPPLLENYSG